MFLERIWPTNKAKYKCILPEQMHTIDINNFASLPTLNTCALDQHINIQRFSARYLAGGICLKEGRTVSRRRLALCALNLAPEDYLANLVHKQIQRYVNAINQFSNNKASLALLCQLQAQLTNSDKQNGHIRTVQNWLGGSSPDKAHFVPPPAEYLPPLVDDLLQFINTQKPLELAHIIAASNQLIVLHPFVDGNGRLQRAFTDSLLAMQTGHPASYISPFLYRLGHNHSGYHSTPTAMLQGDWSQVTSFWHDAINWSNEASIWLLNTVQHLQRTLRVSLALRPVTPAMTSILSLLINHPLLTVQYTLAQTQHAVADIQLALDTLVEFGLLQRYQLRQPMHTVIYECKLVFDAYLAMDEHLFSNDM